MVNVFAFNHLDKEAYAKILALVAMADGVLREEEVALYEARMGHILVPPKVRDHYRKFLRLHFTVNEVVKGVDKRTLLYALRDALWMARIDWDFHERERERVISIGEAAGVSRERMKILDEWVKEGMDWMKRGDTLTLIPLDE